MVHLPGFFGVGEVFFCGSVLNENIANACICVIYSLFLMVSCFVTLTLNL